MLIIDVNVMFCFIAGKLKIFVIPTTTYLRKQVCVNEICNRGILNQSNCLSA